LAGISWVAYYWLATRVVPFQQTQIMQLTTNGKVTIAAISPDGRYVAYVTDEAGLQGRETLWVRQVGTGSDVQIVPPAEVGYGGLIFSRDGDFLYVTQSESKDRLLGVLYKIPVLGGTKKRLIVNVAMAPFWVNPVTLSPDEKRVAFLRHSKARNETALMVANKDGSGEKQLAVRKRPYGFGGPVAWSPNGKTIAVVAFNEAVDYDSLVEVPVQGGAQRPLTPKRWPSVVDLAWVPDGRGLVADTQARSGGQTQIVYVSYANGDVRRITSDLNLYIGEAEVIEDLRHSPARCLHHLVRRFIEVFGRISRFSCGLCCAGACGECGNEARLQNGKRRILPHVLFGWNWARLDARLSTPPLIRFLCCHDSLRVSLLARFGCDPLGAFYGQTANLVSQLTIILGSVLAFDESLHVAAPKKSDASV
jgi:Tol biopolymer transport system component